MHLEFRNQSRCLLALEISGYMDSSLAKNMLNVCLREKVKCMSLKKLYEEKTEKKVCKKSRLSKTNKCKNKKEINVFNVHDKNV